MQNRLKIISKIFVWGSYVYVQLFHCNGNENNLYLPDKNNQFKRKFQMDRFWHLWLNDETLHFCVNYAFKCWPVPLFTQNISHLFMIEYYIRYHYFISWNKNVKMEMTAYRKGLNMEFNLTLLFVFYRKLETICTNQITSKEAEKLASKWPISDGRKPFCEVT